MYENDAEFIAAAREDVPALVAALRAAQEREAKVQRVTEAAWDVCEDSGTSQHLRLATALYALDSARYVALMGEDDDVVLAALGAKEGK
jgi:hypothetical protein